MHLSTQKCWLYRSNRNTVDYVSVLCLPWHPCSVKMKSTTIERQMWSCWLSNIFILYTKMYHTLDSNSKKWGIISKHKWSFEITFTNSNYALSFHYCIVQQASSTAKATLTARLMSGLTCNMLRVSTGKALSTSTKSCCFLTFCSDLLFLFSSPNSFTWQFTV